MNDYEKTTQDIFGKMIQAVKTETANGRTPHVKVAWSSPATKLTKVVIESEQISESLEMRPSEFAAFKKALEENNIALEN